MRRSWFLALVLLFGTTPSKAAAQERTVFIAPEVRTQLATSWDTTNAKQRERGYCLTVQPVLAPGGDTAYVVHHAARSTPLLEDPYQVRFFCPRGTPTLHVHTPTTCDHLRNGNVVYDSCIFGGEDANECFPSGQDRALLDAQGLPFGLIQCDEQVIIVFFPHLR